MTYFDKFFVFIPVEIKGTINISQTESEERILAYYDNRFSRFLNIQVLNVSCRRAYVIRDIGVTKSPVRLILISSFLGGMYGCICVEIRCDRDVMLEYFWRGFVDIWNKHVDALVQNICKEVSRVLGTHVKKRGFLSYCFVFHAKGEQELNDIKKILPSILFLSGRVIIGKNAVLKKYLEDVSPWTSRLFISERVTVLVEPTGVTEVNLYCAIIALLVSFELMLLDAEQQFVKALYRRDLRELRRLRALISSQLSFIRFARRMSNELYDILFSEFLDRMEIDEILKLVYQRVVDADTIISQEQSERLNQIMVILTILLSVPTLFEFFLELGFSSSVSLVFAFIGMILASLVVKKFSKIITK